MTPRSTDLHSGRGFTLVELLLTIAIVGVLVSLLLPAVASAKSGAQRVACMNNQKQLLLAMSMYATDNDDSAPHPNWDFNPRYAGWLCRPPFDKPATNIQTGLLWKYSPNAQIYMCPQDRTNTASFLARRQKYTSYIMNGAACFFETQAFPRTVKVSSVRPDAIVLWQADERNFRDYNDGASKPDEGVTRMHSDGSTAGLISGSVQHIKVREFNQEILKRPGRLWWNPKRKDGAG